MTRGRVLSDAEIARRRAADPLDGTPLLTRLYLSYSENCQACGLAPQPWSAFRALLVEQVAGELGDQPDLWVEP